MKKCAIITLVFIMVLTGGCKIEKTFQDVFITKESVVLIPNTLLDIPGIKESIVESVVELTTVIFSMYSDTPTREPIVQTTENPDSEIVQLVNNIRTKNKLIPLEISSDLCVLAEIRAKEASELWSHTRPDGTKVDSLAEECGVTNWSVIGENLAKHTMGCASNVVVDAWVNSQSHYDNLINSKFRKCGIGEYRSNNLVYVSLIFSD